MIERIQDRLPAIAALAVPVCVGAAWMATSGAPSHYALTNLAVAAVMCIWIAIGRGPHTALSRHVLSGFLVLTLLLPLMIGDPLTSVTGEMVRRWVQAGPLALHTGMIALPPLAVLAARNRKLGAPILLVALLAIWLQPDPATGFALTFAAVGIHHVTKDWKMGGLAVIGFFASLAMAVRGEIPPQPFVERVLVQAGEQSIALALLLAAALAASFALILFAAHLSSEKRFALAGALFGFGILALMSNYPTPLIGYGAAPIIGFGIALGLKKVPQR